MIGHSGEIDFRANSKEHRGKSFSLRYDYIHNRMLDKYVIKTFHVYQDSIIVEFPKLSAITRKQGINLTKVLKIEDINTKIDYLDAYLNNVATLKKHRLWGRIDFDYIAALHGSLAWYYVLENQPDEAINHANKAFNLAPNDTEWVKVNLGHAYILKKETKKGIDIYNQLKNKALRGTSYKTIIMNDLVELEQQGIKIPRKKQIEDVLN